MLENHVQSPVTIKRLRDGLAAPYIDDFIPITLINVA